MAKRRFFQELLLALARQSPAFVANPGKSRRPGYLIDLASSLARVRGLNRTNHEVTIADADSNSSKSVFQKNLELSGVTLTGSLLVGVDFADAVLTGAKMGGVDLTDAVLTGAKMGGVDLTDAVLTGAKMGGVDLTDAVLTGAKMGGVDLTDAVLTGAKMGGVDLTDAVLKGCDLVESDLSNASLTRARLSYARLVGADLSHADLIGAVLSNTQLTNSSLIGADLSHAVIGEWNLLLLAGLRWATTTQWPSEDMESRIRSASFKVGEGIYRVRTGSGGPGGGGRPKKDSTQVYRSEGDADEKAA